MLSMAYDANTRSTYTSIRHVYIGGAFEHLVGFCNPPQKVLLHSNKVELNTRITFIVAHCVPAILWGPVQEEVMSVSF